MALLIHGRIRLNRSLTEFFSIRFEKFTSSSRSVDIGQPLSPFAPRLARLKEDD